MNGPKIIFVHQPKAAGTSLIEGFKATYGKEAIYHDMDNQIIWKKNWLTREMELFIQPYRKYKDRAKYTVIHGHFRREKYARAFPHAFYMTFYRHPVQQIISQYYYWLRSCNPSDTNPMRKWVFNTKPDITDFVNVFLSGYDIQKLKKMDPSLFSFVGITEQIDESFEMLKRNFPELLTDIKAQRINPDKIMGEDYKLSDHERKVIEDKMWQQIKLYEEAKKLFELQRARIF